MIRVCILCSSCSSGPLMFPVTPSSKMPSDRHWSRLTWFTGCVRSTQKPLCSPPVAKVRLHFYSSKYLPPSPVWLTCHTCVHRHRERLCHEQDGQPDRRGGGSLPWQQLGCSPYHVPPGGPLPHAHALLQHALVSVVKHKEPNTQANLCGRSAKSTDSTVE